MEWLALAVSVCAIALTIYQAYLSRQHNRLSVRPSLSTFVDTDPAPDNPRITLISMKLMNSGLGPAYIKSFEILVRGEAFTVKTPDEMRVLVQKHFNGSLVDAPCRYVVFGKHHVMAQGKQEEIAQIAVRDITPAQTESLKDFALRVRYESAYGESFTYDTRQHLEVA